MLQHASQKGSQKVLEAALDEKVLGRVLRRCLAVGIKGRESSEKGS